MARLKDLDPNHLTPAQRAVYETIASGPRGRVEGPLRVWVTSPELADKAQVLGVFCRFGTSLPPRLSELAILVTGAYWQSGFEWYAHAPLATRAGIPAAAVDAIRVGQPPALQQADEKIVYQFAHELVHSRRVSQPTYVAAVAALGEKTVVELVAILGYYALISMTINAFEVPLPPGEPDPFAAVLRSA